MAERSRGLMGPRGRVRKVEAYLKKRYKIFYGCHFESMPPWLKVVLTI